MKNCDVYQLVSFLADEMIKSGSKQDIVVSAAKIKGIAALLYQDDIDCDFGYYSFESVVRSEPIMLNMNDHEITVHHSFFKAGGTFVNYDVDQDLMEKLNIYWKKVNEHD